MLCGVVSREELTAGKVLIKTKEEAKVTARSEEVAWYTVFSLYSYH